MRREVLSVHQRDAQLSTMKAARAENHSPQTTKAAAPCASLGAPAPATETSFWGDGAHGGSALRTLTSDTGYKDKLLLGRGYWTKSIRVPKSSRCCREWSV